MKLPASIRFLTTALFLLLLAERAATAEEKPQPATPAPATSGKKPASLKMRYNAPGALGGDAGVRITGGTRGGGDKLPSVYVLAPEHLALTTQPAPSLFWYQTAPAKTGFELSVTEPKKAKPVLTLKGKGEQSAGIHSVSLARNGVTLAPGVNYQWSVALVPDAANRSKDVIAIGMIRRVAPPKELADKIASASGAERAALYAQAGYWYDALQSISDAIAANPKDASLHVLRASLLDQGKLPEAAAHERK